MADDTGWHIGRRLAPPRFLLFLGLAIAGTPIAVSLLGWREGGMIAFDVAALGFLLSVAPLLASKPDAMRKTSASNDANRALLLVITAIVTLTVLVAVASELAQTKAPDPLTIVFVVATLAIAWVFSNLVYALHYAHVFYGRDDDGAGDQAGLEFPDTAEPDYWDFIYFSFCLGMTFQVSDVQITSRLLRKIVTAHCIAAFVFNLGIVGFTINVLGGG